MHDALSMSERWERRLVAEIRRRKAIVEKTLYPDREAGFELLYGSIHSDRKSALPSRKDLRQIADHRSRTPGYEINYRLYSFRGTHLNDPLSNQMSGYRPNRSEYLLSLNTNSEGATYPEK